MKQLLRIEIHNISDDGKDFISGHYSEGFMSSDDADEMPFEDLSSAYVEAMIHDIRRQRKEGKVE